VNLVAVVLNWNGGDDTLAALDSLGAVPAICVDNGSTDGSDFAVEERFPQAELIRTGANLGFAGGNNVGIRRALERGADWVLLLNNDAVAEPGVPDALERAAAARPDAGLLACLILGEDGAAVQYAGASYHPRLGYSGRVATTPPPSPQDVDRVDGAAVAVSRAAAERAGLLDEELFLYVEDVRGHGRTRVDGQPLLRHAQHDRGRRAARAVAARPARPPPRRGRRDAPRAGGDAPGARRGGHGRAGRLA